MDNLTIFDIIYKKYKPKQNIRHSIEKGLKPKLKRDKLGRFCGKESDNNEELNNI